VEGELTERSGGSEAWGAALRTQTAERHISAGADGKVTAAASGRHVGCGARLRQLSSTG